MVIFTRAQKIPPAVVAAPRHVANRKSAIKLCAQEVVQAVEGRLLCGKILTLVFFPQHENKVDLHGKFPVETIAEKQHASSEHVCIEERIRRSISRAFRDIFAGRTSIIHASSAYSKV